MVSSQGRVSGLPPFDLQPRLQDFAGSGDSQKSCFHTRRRTGESCVLDCTTAGTRTKKNAIDEILSNWLKALLHMARTLFIHSSPITNATQKNKPLTFRKYGRTLIAIGFGDLKRSQERPVACARFLHFFAKLCTK